MPSKKKYLAITADDYGPHPFINRGILRAVELDRITAVGVFGNPYDGIDYDPNREITRLVEAIGDKKIGIGVHLTISSGRPVSGLPDLILEDGQFQHMRSFDFSTHKAHLRAMRDEIKAQIWVVKNVLDRYGIPIDHVSSHQSLHFLFRAYFDEVLNALDDMNIRTTVRSPIPISKEPEYCNYFTDSIMKKEGRRRAILLADNNLALAPYILKGLRPDNLKASRARIYEKQHLCGDHFFDNYYGKPKEKELLRILNYFPDLEEIHRGEVVVHLGDGNAHRDLELHGINTDYFHHRINELLILQTFPFRERATEKKIFLRTMRELND